MNDIDSIGFPKKKEAERIRRGNLNARKLPFVNISYVVVALLITAFGLIVVFSATINNDDYSFTRQVIFVVVGIVMMFFLFRYDYHRLSPHCMTFLIISLVLTLLPHLPLVGLTVNGARSWISIAGLGLQPGELAKVTVILMCASCVSRYRGRLDDLKEYLKCTGMMLIPFAGIMTQPDLGTGLVYLFIIAVSLLMGGARPRFLLATASLAVLLVAGLLIIDPLMDKMLDADVLLKDYQRARLLVFMNNSYDLSGNGYNLQQAKIAIGSGGFLGKGYLHATQSTMGYLPESATDFIFCVLAEEFGFVGSMILIALYVVLIIKSFNIAKESDDLFGCILVLCISGMWLFQILENIGMDIGLMPITGIPLPFVSYGSSFMIVNFILLGLVGSVWAHNGR